MLLACNILLDGVVYGMLLFMIALGLSITMGLMRVTNLAHGVFAMLGGYLLATFATAGGLPWPLSVALAVSAVALGAVPLERLLIRRVYARSELDQVLLTIGVVFCAVSLITMAYGSSLKAVPFPALLSGSLDLGFRVMPAQRVLVLAAGVSSFLGVYVLVERTVFGVHLRAAIDHPQIAGAVGINTRRVASIAFAVGAGMAALGGIVGAELLPMEPFYPLKYLVLFLAVVAVGGLGSIAGTLAAAMVLGLIETAAKYLVPQLASILFFVTILVILSVRPQGLFGRA